MSKTQMKLEGVRLYWYKYDKVNNKYSVAIALNEEHVRTLKELAADTKAKKDGIKTEKDITNDEIREQYGEALVYHINASSLYEPRIFDAEMKKFPKGARLGMGTVANVAINTFIAAQGPQKGRQCYGLNAVQVLEMGELGKQTYGFEVTDGYLLTGNEVVMNKNNNEEASDDEDVPF